MNQKNFVMLWWAMVRDAVAAGIHESGGNNLGAQVEKYQKACGGEPGESWCMYFLVFYALKVLAGTLNVPVTSDNVVVVCRTCWPKLTRTYGIAVTGSCGAQRDFQARRDRVVMRENITQIKPGWLIFYAWSQADVESRTPRHVGMCDVEWSKSTLPIVSLEGNTGMGGDQSDGDGAARKERSFDNVVCVVKTYL